MKYQVLEHTADLKIKALGKDLSELFKNAAEAMYEAMAGSKQQAVSDTANNKQQIINLEVSAADYESLLVNFLNELLCMSDIQHKGFGVNDLIICSETLNSKKEKKQLKLLAKLVPYSLSPLAIEIKGATYHNLKVKKINDGFEATIIIDI